MKSKRNTCANSCLAKQGRHGNIICSKLPSMLILKNTVLNLVIFLLLVSSNSYADTPLTSINFWTIHADDFAVQNALRNNKMDKSTIDFILDESNSLEIRLSVINAIGWKFNSDNKKSTTLLRSILKKYKVNSIDNLFDVKHIDILTCYTYSLALDNYKNVDNIIQLSREVSNLDPNNFYSNYIYTLIKSQKYSLSSQWCNVFSVFKELRKSDRFNSEFGNKLYDKTYEFIGTSDKYCNESIYDYNIDLNNEIRFYELEKSNNKLYFRIYPILNRDGKIEVYSDSGELKDSMPFVSADFVILDITNYNYNQYTIKFTDVENQSITITLKKII